MKTMTLSIAGMLLLAQTAIADVWTSEDLSAALGSGSRSEADVARDGGRKPAEVVVFAGVEPGITVLDVMAGSGYYSEIFSIAVGPEGKVYAQNPQWMLEFMKGVVDRAISERLKDDRLPNVSRIDGDIDAGGLADNSVDVAFTALNFHDVYYDYGEAAALAVLADVHRVLKPGGLLLIIDHNGPDNLDGEQLKQLHRMPEALTKEVVAKTDFEAAAESDLLRNPDDDLTKIVFAKGARGATDRYVLLYRK